MIRTDDPSDGRAKTVTVTGEGHAVSENIEQTIAVLRADVLGDLVKEDLEATCRVLKAFIGKDGAVEAYEVEGDSQRSD
jgi:MarR family transcriptional regulator for hemolysin